MNISEAAERCGLPSKTLRYYETIGLVVPERQENNEYRVYSSADLARLVLLRRARAAGFSLDECRILLMRIEQRALLSTMVPAENNERMRLDLEEQRARLVQLQTELIALDAVLVDVIEHCARQPVAAELMSQADVLSNSVAGVKPIDGSWVESQSIFQPMKFTLISGESD